PAVKTSFSRRLGGRPQWEDSAVSYSAPNGSAARIPPADLNHVNALLPPGVDLVLQSGIGILGIHLRAPYRECSRITGLGDIATKVLRPWLFEHRDLVN